MSIHHFELVESLSLEAKAVLYCLVCDPDVMLQKTDAKYATLSQRRIMQYLRACGYPYKAACSIVNELKTFVEEYYDS